MVGPFEKAPLLAFRCLPIGLQPKKDGNFRLIHHFSWPQGDSVNSRIPSEYTSVQYHTVLLAIASIKKTRKPCFHAKTDIKSALQIIPVHSLDYDLLGFDLKGGAFIMIPVCQWVVQPPAISLGHSARLCSMRLSGKCPTQNAACPR